MTRRVQGIVDELKRALQAIYGARLKGLYIYGSYARGEEDRESDLDVLVVLDAIDDYGDEIDRTSEAISRLSLEYEISISRAFVSEQDWRDGHTPFLSNVREEAIPA